MANDNVRTRPPVVSDIHISNARVGNVEVQGGRYSSYQAIVIQGPVPFSYNGPDKAPKITPVINVSITDGDLGTPVNAANPLYLYNVEGLTLKNVTIGGTRYNKIVSAAIGVVAAGAVLTLNDCSKASGCRWPADVDLTNQDET